MPFTRVVDLVDPVEAVNLNQYAAALEGDAGAGRPITLTALNDSTNYALRVANQDTTNGRALKVFKANLTDAWMDITKDGVSVDLLRLVHQASTPNAPGAGLTLVYPKSSGGLFYREGAAGSEVQIATSGAGFVTLTGTETLTNKTLTSPVLNSPNLNNWYDDGNYLYDLRNYGLSANTAYLVVPTGTATLTGDAVTSIATAGTVEECYASPPAVILSGGGGSGATATAVLTGNRLTSITVDTGGSGYTSAPTVTIQPAWYDTPANVTANTAAVHAALAAAGTAPIYCPPGVYLTNAINATSASGAGFILQGAGGRFMPSINVHGGVWWDCTGRGGCQFNNLEMGDTGMPCIPTVGVLIANDNTQNASNVHTGLQWYMAGYYSVACLYGVQFNSSRFIRCNWSNAYRGGTAAAVYCSANNKAGITSAFTTISTTFAGCSDLTFIGCEFHGDNYVSAQNHAIRLENAEGVRIIGSPISAANVSPLKLDLDERPGSTPGYVSLTIKGGGLYPETAVTPDYAIHVANPDGTGYIKSLTLDDCDVTAVTGIMKAEASTTINQWHMAGWWSNGAATTMLQAISGNLTLNDCDLFCNNLTLSVGAGGIINRGLITRHSTITAAGDSSVKISGNSSNALQVARGDVGAPSIIFAHDDTNTGVYSPGGDQVAASAGGTQIWSITPTLMTVTQRLTGNAGFAATKIATPSNPAAGSSALYPKSDEHWYRLTSAGTETEVLDRLSTTPSARVYRTTDQLIPTTSIQVIGFDAERFDNDTIHDNSTNNTRLTCKTAGLYLIVANVRWDANTTGGRGLEIRLNGSTMIAENFCAPTPSSVMSHNLTTLYRLAVNAYVECTVTQFSGGDLNVKAIGNAAPEFMMARIAA